MALKLNRRPPLTTLATRLIWTTRSSSVSLFGSILANWSAPSSELEAGFAGAVGQRLDPPVVPEPGPVEDNLLDPRAPGALGDQAANGLGLVGLWLLGGLQLLLEAGGRGKRLARRIVDHLRIDVSEAAEYGEARAFGRAREAEPDALVPLLARAAAGGDRRHRVDPFVNCRVDRRVISRLTSWHRSCRPCRPCGGSPRRGSGRPCPCRAPACGSIGPSRRPGRPAPCLCPRPSDGPGFRPRS